MNSCLYRGHVWHARLQPVLHRFQYPVFFFGLDLDELDTLPARVPLFGYNRRRLLAVHDRDYLEEGAGTIREKLQRVLAAHGLGQDLGRVFLVTAARYFNYVFNPVSFYYCFARSGELRCAVAEVNNTFRERHLYVLDRPQAQGAVSAFDAPKAFHVSPFNDLAGEYRFSFSAPQPEVDVRIDLVKQGEVVFRSGLRGRALPLNGRQVAATLLRHPLSAALTFPRILVQAGQLYGRKKLPVHAKPVPNSAMTIRTAPATWWERQCEKMAVPILGRLQRGRLVLARAQGEPSVFGGADPGPEARIVVRDPHAWVRLVRDGEIGLGEGFMQGEWTSPDVTSVIRLFIENRDRLNHGDVETAWLGRQLNRLLHAGRANTLRGSRRNIAAHYDLSNEFFQLWLDPTLLYSSAVFQYDGQSLEEAQLHKVRLLLEKARLRPEHHLLEIGSGWGSLALEAVRQTGCRVTSVTVSQQQLELARARAREAGVADRIEFRLCDYREITGQYDRLISIEMLEAVGHRYLGEFFAACERVLKPEGLAVLQVITIPDQRYEGYRRSTDWIQKHVFPGGHLPSLSAIVDAMTARSRFFVEQVDNIGIHYAQTLREWRARFDAARPQVRALGFDETFLRKWHYYLCYCEAAFDARVLNNLHLVLTRPGNRSLDAASVTDRARSSPAARPTSPG